jgi:glucose-like phosphotransferase system IIB component
MIMQFWQYAIIIVVLILISLIVLKLKQKDFSSEVNKLIQYLGGKENIIDSQINLSRLKVTLKDTSIVNKEGIQKLGAKGIVEIDNELKIILGPNSKQIKKYMADLK